MQYTYEEQHFTESYPKPKPTSKIQPDISKKRKKGTPTRFSKGKKKEKSKEKREECRLI